MNTYFAHHNAAHTSSMTSVAMFALLVVVLLAAVAVISHVTRKDDK